MWWTLKRNPACFYHGERIKLNYFANFWNVLVPISIKLEYLWKAVKRKCVYLHACVCVCAPMCRCMCVRVCTCMHVCMCTCSSMPVCAHARARKCVGVCARVKSRQFSVAFLSFHDFMSRVGSTNACGFINLCYFRRITICMNLFSHFYNQNRRTKSSSETVKALLAEGCLSYTKEPSSTGCPDYDQTRSFRSHQAE